MQVLVLSCHMVLHFMATLSPSMCHLIYQDRSLQYRSVNKIQICCALVFPFTLWLLLTTASPSGGWVPEISRSFHCVQPAPRLRLVAWLANPGKPAMSPQALEGGQAPITDKQGEREERGREGEKQKLPGTKNHHANAWLCQCSGNNVYSDHMEFWRMHLKRHRWSRSNTCALCC